MNNVRNKAGTGSPRIDLANGRRKGMRSSLAKACKSRGAPRDKKFFEMKYI